MVANQPLCSRGFPTGFAAAIVEVNQSVHLLRVQERSPAIDSGVTLRSNPTDSQVCLAT